MVPAVAARHGLLLVLVASVLMPLSAVALEQDDPMSKWLGSSEHDRTRVLDELRAKGGKLRQDSSSVLACMNAAAEIAGHQDLRVGDVAEACSESPPSSHDPKTDI